LRRKKKTPPDPRASSGNGEGPGELTRKKEIHLRKGGQGKKSFHVVGVTAGASGVRQRRIKNAGFAEQNRNSRREKTLKGEREPAGGGGLDLRQNCQCALISSDHRWWGGTHEREV